MCNETGVDIYENVIADVHMFTFFLLLRNNADAMRNWLVCVSFVFLLLLLFSFLFLSVFDFTRIRRHTLTDTIQWFTFFVCVEKHMCSDARTQFHLWISLFIQHAPYMFHFWRSEKNYIFTYFVYVCVCGVRCAMCVYIKNRRKYKGTNEKPKTISVMRMRALYFLTAKRVNIRGKNWSILRGRRSRKLKTTDKILNQNYSYYMRSCVDMS